MEAAAISSFDTNPRLRNATVAGLIALAVLIRVVLFMGMDGRDALGYNLPAYLISVGKYEPVRHVMALRFPVILPMAASLRLFGVGEFSSSLPFLVYSAGALLMTYHIAARLAGARLALLALMIACFYPLDIFNSTDIHADLPMAFFHTLSVFLLTRSTPHSGPRTVPSSSSCVLSGVAVGMSYLCKEPGLVMLAVLWVMLGALKANFRKYVLVFAGVAVVLVAEMVFYRLATGDPVYRLSTALFYGHRDAVMSPMYTKTAGLWMLEYLEMMVNPFCPDFVYTAGILFVALLGLAAALRNKSIGMKLTVLWFVTIFALFNFMPADLQFRFPAQAHYPRTLSFLTTPAVVLSAYFVLHVLGARCRRLGIVMLGVMLLFGIICGYVLHRDARSLTDSLRQAAVFVKERPNAVFYTDRRSVSVLSYYMGYMSANVRIYEDCKPGEGFEKYLVYEPTWTKFLQQAYGHRIPSWVAQVLESGEPVWTSIPATHRRVRGLLGSGPVIRRVPSANIYSLNH